MTHLFLSLLEYATFPYIYQMEQSHQAAAACVIKRDLRCKFSEVTDCTEKLRERGESRKTCSCSFSKLGICSYITEKRRY